MPYTYEYDRPAVTVDCVVFGLDDQKLSVMLIQRDRSPFEGMWAIPGGFVHMDEPLEDAAIRELFEETGLKDIFLEQLYTFGKPDRDPRGRVITIAYYALVNLKDYNVHPQTDARDAEWFAVDHLPKLAFDHRTIMEVALTRLKGKIRYEPIGFELLPRKFTLTQLQQLYEIILGKKLDKRNFRKKIQKMQLLNDLDEMQQDVSHRAARLYSFDRQKYDELKMKGFNFEL